MTEAAGRGPPRTTLALAVLALGLGAAVLFAPLDSAGLVRRPPPPPGGGAAFLPFRASPTPEPDAVTPWPATAEGLAAAMDSVAPALASCHAAWRAGDSDAPEHVVASARLAPRPDGTARVVDVLVESRAGGTPRMAACTRAVLASLTFTDPPETDLVVRFALPRDAAP